MCPFCKSPVARIIRKGYFKRVSTKTTHVQRYFCKDCRKYFSERTGCASYREQKSHVNQALFRLLCSGVSQRRCAFILGVRRPTIARKLVKLSKVARSMHAQSLKECPLTDVVIFDEMETFEHSKCKPVSICVAVEKKSRRILAAEIAQMPAKGHLAKISRKRYGRRTDKRPQSIRKVLNIVKIVSSDNLTLRSDECPRYPKYVREILPFARHEVFLGRRGCVVGQGELKRGGFDPLFSLNHSCAMFRDNLKCLSRRTWCTTKKVRNLQMRLDLYICFHNMLIDKKTRYYRLKEFSGLGAI